MSRAPLLLARSLRFASATADANGELEAGVQSSGEARLLETPAEWIAPGESLALIGGARGLLPCLIQPELAARGTVELLGEEPKAALASGRVAIAPQVLPAPASLRLKEALEIGARLVRRSADDVEAALTAVRLGGLAKHRLGSLTPLQSRLAGLAHGLVSDPELLLLDDPFARLEDDACEMMELLLEAQTSGRRWLATLDIASPWGRRWLLRAESAVAADVGALAGPLAPRELNAKVLWARFSNVTQELKAALRAAGGGLVETPHPKVLMVRQLDGKIVARAAVASGCDLLELSPFGPLTP